jgi:hypothetical protein
MRKITKRSAAVVAATVVAVGGGAAAWAAATGWDINGSGTGDASAATITSLSASSDMGSVAVYPGLTAQLIAKVSNPNDFPVKLNAGNVVATNVTVTSGANPAACHDALIAAPNTLVAGFVGQPTIPKKANNVDVNSTVAVANTLPQSCAGTHLKVFYSFTGVSTV